MHSEKEEIARRRARWLSSRRGLLELDMLLSQFIESAEFENLTSAELKLYTQLLSWQDHDFLNALENRDAITDKKLSAILKKIQKSHHPPSLS